MSPSPTSVEPAERLAAEIPAAGGRASAHLLDVTDDAQTQAVVDAVVAETGRMTSPFVTPASAKYFPAQNCRLPNGAR